MIPTFFPVAVAIAIGCALPSSRTLSAAKYLRCAIEIGASTRARRQAVSHGWGQTLPIDAGSGKTSIIVACASANRPSAISLTYFWQSVCAGQFNLHGPKQSPSWSPIKSSIANLRAFCARSLRVLTTMPSATFVAQARKSFGHFSTSTTHTPQAP